MLNEVILNHLYQITDEEKGFLLGESFDHSIFSDEYPDMVDYRKLLEPGEKIRARMHSRFGAYPNHRHNFVELVYQCKGKTIHVVNKTGHVELHEGNILFIGQQAYHSIEVPDFNDIALNLFILPDMFDNVIPLIDKESIVYDFLFSCMRNGSNTCPVLLFNVKNALPVQNLMENILWYLSSERNNRMKMVEQMFISLLLELQDRAESLVELMPQDYDRSIVLKALNYIKTNYVCGSLNEISAELKQPAYRLSRLIRANTGKTFSELILDARIHKAMTLLSNTDMSIQDIINTVGYNNISFFYQQFRKMTGQTPAEFRNKG